MSVEVNSRDKKQRNDIGYPLDSFSVIKRSFEE